MRSRKWWVAFGYLVNSFCSACGLAARRTRQEKDARRRLLSVLHRIGSRTTLDIFPEFWRHVQLDWNWHSAWHVCSADNASWRFPMMACGLGARFIGIFLAINGILTLNLPGHCITISVLLFAGWLQIKTAVLVSCFGFNRSPLFSFHTGICNDQEGTWHILSLIEQGSKYTFISWHIQVPVQAWPPTISGLFPQDIHSKSRWWWQIRLSVAWKMTPVIRPFSNCCMSESVFMLEAFCRSCPERPSRCIMVSWTFKFLMKTWRLFRLMHWSIQCWLCAGRPWTSSHHWASWPKLERSKSKSKDMDST